MLILKDRFRNRSRRFSIRRPRLRRRAIEDLIERFPSVLKALPDDIREDVVVGFFSAGILGQGLLRLPEEMRRKLYECKAGEDDFLAFEDEQTSILVMLGVQADKLLAEQDGPDHV